ncbi:TIGR00366 family protein [uncultured Cyclobacterium sp.]|uniref:short-chain fatty acid transporter n=1 Tax=uncultured Cyclobacterium sp. TaxID=453820 RepID=UPI0030ECCA1E|tara:strand:+ start:107842 stop:109239 length:1398 start_codon:yes stop_codon:yes gene_type:complete
MLEKLGEKFIHIFLKYLPNSFVFAIILTLITGIVAIAWLEVSPMEIIKFWYMGFFDLLGFSMQIVLIIITGFSIALSPLVKRGIGALSTYIKTPAQVYFVVVFIGMLLSMISFGWVVITCVLARELALRVKGINYPFLIACAYFSFNSWVLGFSSSIPLLLNSDNNFMIETGLLSAVIPTTYTLQSSLNIAMMGLIVIGGSLLMFLLRPKHFKNKELSDLTLSNGISDQKTIKEEASELHLPFTALSDKLNNSILLQMIIFIMGLTYIVFHFSTRGFDLNFNIMIFIFLIVGMALHQTPSRYAIAMKRSSSNVSGILFQYPFYAGIMGIMMYTGLGDQLGQLMAEVATLESYPFYAYLTGAIVNFAIPSAGGEFAVIGPSIINAIKELGAGLPENEITAMISRASLSVAYGESLSNLLQPFYLLVVLPIMGNGVNIQARDVMGYMVIPFIILFILQSLLVVLWPL